MAKKSMIQGILVWAILPVLVVGIAAVWLAKSSDFHVGSVAVAAEMSQSEFEKRVRAYLLEHPEVIGAALSRLEARHGELDAAAATAALKAHSADVFEDRNSPIGGNSKGNVTLVEFFDYNCPYCRAMAPLMAKAEAADPWLRIVYKEFPILGPGSAFAAKAALAAAKQGKYVAFHRALYEVRGHVDEAKVLEVAKAIGLDVERMKADIRDKAISAELEKTIKLGEALHITGTPGFVVSDQVTTGARDFDGLQALIASGRQANQNTK